MQQHRRTIVVLAMMVAVGLVASANGAHVYHSRLDDAVPSDIAGLPNDGTPLTLYLYITAGDTPSAPGRACTGYGTGEEICGFDVQINKPINIDIVSFIPEPGVQFAVLNNSAVRANGLNADGAIVGPLRIGALTLSTSGPGQSNVIAFGGRIADARLNAQPVDVTVLAQSANDADADFVLDYADNCTAVANTDQRDADADQYGNACDPDLNNDGAVNAADLGILRQRFHSADPTADFNGDGAVNVIDLGILRQYFFLPPGPSYIDAGGAP